MPALMNRLPEWQECIILIKAQLRYPQMNTGPKQVTETLDLLLHFAET